MRPTSSDGRVYELHWGIHLRGVRVPSKARAQVGHAEGNWLAKKEKTNKQYFENEKWSKHRERR